MKISVLFTRSSQFKQLFGRRKWSTALALNGEFSGDAYTSTVWPLSGAVNLALSGSL